MLGVGGGFLLLIFGAMIAVIYQQRKFYKKKLNFMSGGSLLPEPLMPEDSISMAGALPPTAPSAVTGYCKSVRSVKNHPRGHIYPSIYADSDYVSMGGQKRGPK